MALFSYCLFCLSLWLVSLCAEVTSSSLSSEELGRRAPVPQGFVAAPFYPAPRGGWVPEWANSYEKAARLVANMTLAEKVNLTSGTGIFMGRCVGVTGSALRVGFPQLCLQDGPLGLRNTQNNTAFPAGITTGATWDKVHMYRRGIAIGEEFRGKGVNIHLGPNVGPLGRKPRGGRNWEGFGADPVLQGFGAALTIIGIQEKGVIATVKHLIGNEQEQFRQYNTLQAGISSNIDDRTLHELYLWPFADGVRAGVGAVMTAYNAVNGSACSQNSHLINGILKEELGFQGFVMTDWLAHISGVASALAGLDMDMPGDTMIPLFGNSYWNYELSRSVLNRSVPVDRLNDMTTRIVAAWYQMGQDQGYPPPNFSTYTDKREGPLYPGAVLSPYGVVNEFANVQGNHAELSRNISRDAVTLLKNLDGTLPLDASSVSLTVFGDDARANVRGANACADRGCNEGVLGMGWGSGSSNYPYIDAPIDALRRRVAGVEYYPTNTYPLGVNPSPEDVAIVFINADSGENYITVEGNPGDRTAAGLHAWHKGDGLVKAAAEKFSTVIVVVHTVGPILVEEWIDLPSVKGVLFAHLPGQEAGSSLTDVLFGDVSPSGHLPYSIPAKESDYPPSLNLVQGLQLGQPQDTFTEGLYIDYRWLNKQNTTARFPFGFGLSYTTFTYSAIITAVTPLSLLPPSPAPKAPTPEYSTTVPPASEAYFPPGFRRIQRYLYSFLPRAEADAAAASTGTYPYPSGYSAAQRPTPPPAGGSQGGNPALWDVVFDVAVTVANAGAAPGRAVAQLYVQHPPRSPYDTPPVQLRDFAKSRVLAPGEAEVLRLRLTRRDLSVWDVARQNWVVPGAIEEAGEYTVWVGESSAEEGRKIRCGTELLSCVTL